MKRRRDDNFHVENNKKHVIQLNEVIGIAARRIFQSQLLNKNASASEIHAELPELCSFIERMWQQKPASCIRELFRHPEAQWLTRSAMTSGITSILSSLLLEQAFNDASSKKFLVVLIFFDAVLTPCNKMLLVHSRHTCEWRHRKPKYHQMECFKRWNTISPFLSRLIIQSESLVLLPQALSAFERDYLASPLLISQKVNCWFAQVVGCLGLIMSVPQAAASIVEFLLRWRLLTRRNDSDNYFFDDLLMEKFFSEMRELAFKKSSAIESGIHEALPKQIADALVRLGDTQEIPSHLLVLTAAACTLSKELPALILDELLSRLKGKPEEHQRSLVVFLQGLCGHVNLIPIDKNLDFFVQLIQALPQQQTSKQLYRIFYVFGHRVDDFGDKKIRNSMKFLQFQQEMLECIQNASDLLSEVPVPLLKIFLNKALDITAEEDIEVFIQEIRPTASSHMLVDPLSACVPFAESEYLVNFVHMKALILPHLIPVRRDLLRHEKARKQLKSTTMEHPIPLGEDVSIVLMSEILEHIFGFLSHKRLCRMALVCQTFHIVSKSSRLWEKLYRNKWPQVTCDHGFFMQHRWKEMYQKRFKADRRIVKRRREIKRNKKILEESDLMSPFVMEDPILCTCCGCNNILMTESELQKHLQLHREFQCQVETCRVSCLNRTQLLKHLREAHPKPLSLLKKKPQPKKRQREDLEVMEGQQERPIWTCEHCTKKTYLTKRGLKNHVEKTHNHQL